VLTEKVEISFKRSMNLRKNFGQSDSGAGLAVNNLSQTSLALHNAIRNLKATAQSGQEQNDLKRINIVRNYNQTGFLLFDQLGDVVGAKSDSRRTLGHSLGLALLAFLGSLLQTLLFGLGALWTVLVKQIEDLSG
jgi:hypothetical protein